MIGRGDRRVAGGQLRDAQVFAEPPGEDHGLPRAQPHADLEPGHRVRTDAHVDGDGVHQPGARHDAAEHRRRGATQPLQRDFRAVIVLRSCLDFETPAKTGERGKFFWESLTSDSSFLQCSTIG